MSPEIIKLEDLDLARETLRTDEEIGTFRYFCTGANPHGHIIEARILLKIGEKPPLTLLSCPWHKGKTPKLIR